MIRSGRHAATRTGKHVALIGWMSGAVLVALLLSASLLSVSDLWADGPSSTARETASGNTARQAGIWFFLAAAALCGTLIAGASVAGAQEKAAPPAAETPSPSSAGSGTFPKDAFNGMQITYSVSGATLGEVKDQGGFTTTRSIKGVLQATGTLGVSGSVSVGGFGADLTVTVQAGKETKEYKVYIKNEKGSSGGKFNVSVPIPAGATGGGFCVRMDGRYSMGGGHRGLIVSGEFKGAGAEAESGEPGSADKTGTGGGGGQESGQDQRDERVTLELTYPVGRSPKVFTTGWLFGAKCLVKGDGKEGGEPRDLSDKVQWSGTGKFAPAVGPNSRPSFAQAGENTIVLTVEVDGKKTSKTFRVTAVSPVGFVRMGNLSKVDADAHGCPACPHTCVGPVNSGSPEVLIDGMPAARVGDRGVHAACCGPNMFEIVSSDSDVLINGRAAATKNSVVKHCGGEGKMIQWYGNESNTVDAGDDSKNKAKDLPKTTDEEKLDGIKKVFGEE